MSQIDNQISWCLKKAEKELKADGKHRGLVRIIPSQELAKAHISKAEHNLKAISDFKKYNYSDWSASAAFYSIYHCLLAILAKSGYESRNQECTLALIYQLIESKQINLDKDMIEKIHSLNHEEKHESPTIIEVREQGQYGVKLSLEDETFNNLLSISKSILEKTKEIIQT